MRKSVTKNEVLKAIATEPLAPNSWAHDSIKRNGKCAVCAVGAVIRAAGATEIGDLRYHAEASTSGRSIVTGDIGSLLAQGLYMNALSCHFETVSKQVTGAESGADIGLLRGQDLRKVRASCKAFVTEHFPARVYLK